MRIPDNLVDQNISHLNEKERRAHYLNISIQLRSMLDKRKHEYHAWTSNYSRLFLDNNIPIEYSISFYEAMIQDCDYKREYDTIEKLEQYMYGSAVVVGFMMNCILWVRDLRVYEYAKALWEAMQLTNFLRDIKEDKELLERVYVQDYQIMDYYHRARNLYRKAELWYHYLPEYARPAISLAWALYEWILDKLEKNNFNIKKSARTTLFDKLKIIRRWKMIYNL